MDSAHIKIQVILASIRHGRFGDKPAHWILGEAKKLERVEAELIDLKDYPLPFLEEETPPSAAKGNYADNMVKKFGKKISEADAYIIVTPEYNHGYSGVLKNALDSIFVEWNNKPVAFVGYGGVGGARAVEQLRQVVIELQMTPIRYAVHIPMEVYMAVMKEQVPTNPELFKPVVERAGSMLSQLLWFAKALKAARQNK